MVFSNIITAMYSRTLESALRLDRNNYPVLAITGPRQTGKTTLAREIFGDYHYILLEDPDLRDLARSDPRGFFERYPGNLVLDEVQKAPELLSYLQGRVDAEPNLHFVLTGSENLLLSEKIAQSLAGRVRTFHLLPLSREEIKQETAMKTLFYGGYPRIHEKSLDPTVWCGQYYSTYVQRDVRSILNVGDLDQFDRFVRVTASRVGQLADFSSIAADCGISQPTAKAWFSVLKSTFISFSLEPHFKNFGKRITKSPKIYFFDTGLLCYLLRIQSEAHLESHPLFGLIFENWVIAERMKKLFNRGQESLYYFWRDQKGHEVDLVADLAGELHPTEIKSSVTFHESFFKNVDYLAKLQKKDVNGECIYRGVESFIFKGKKVTSWQDV